MTELIHGIRYETALPHCRPGVDSLALAAFAPARGQIADLCCGAGLIGLLLCARNGQCSVLGFDRNGQACDEARQNAQRNGLSARCRFVQIDLRAAGALPSGCADVAVANPPYHPAGGRPSSDPARACARSERFCSLDALCAAAARLVRTGGSFCLVYPAERLADVFASLRGAGFEPKRLQLIRHTVAHPPSRVLVDARRCGGKGLRFEPDLILYDERGETDAYRAVCGR